VAAGEGDDGAELVDVLVGALRELRAAAGEAEHGALVLDPVLDGLLDGEALVRRVGEGDVVAALGPGERRHVPRRRGDQAPQPLAGLRAVPLPVHHVLARELHRAVLVVARRVVLQRRRARCRDDDVLPDSPSPPPWCVSKLSPGPRPPHAVSRVTAAAMLSPLRSRCY
jgi:hypothetical protein